MNYKDTIFLPQTSFSMRGNLSEKEPLMVEKWQKENLYKKIREARAGAETFLLHWGPPYANGHLHAGHALNGILKDIVVRSHTMMGENAPLVPGWDCHGLPIEWKVEEAYRKAGKKKEDVPINEFRQECRSFARKWVDIQAREFDRLGILADTKKPYITMDFKSEAAIAKEFMTFLESGAVYKGVRPIMWSPLEKTALADAEMEYQDKKSPAIYVAFDIQKTDLLNLKNTKVVIWTTTPWTIPGNRAVAYGADIDYVTIEVKSVEEESKFSIGSRFLLAKNLHEKILAEIGVRDFEVIAHFKGSDLANTILNHPFKHLGYDFDVPMIEGHHVTTETGTGLVHTAPGHGPDDFDLGRKFNLEIADTINDNAVYTDSVKEFSGIHVFKADPVVLTALHKAGALVYKSTIKHSYPHSWRSKAPLIFRTTPQWFIRMEHEVQGKSLRDCALSEIKKTNWIPAQGENRINGMVKDRPDWCLSRQRSWGVPITLYTHKETGEILKDPAVNKRILDIFESEGCDVWFGEDHSRFLTPDHNTDDYTPCQDILDVWFESGATQGFVLEGRPELQRPADMYLEGSDQHRGWFQSSLLVGCGTRGDAPFKTVVTHGFTVDAKGLKMSKSVGNTVSPMDIADEVGVEILRLWVVSCDYTDDLRMGKDILKHQQDIYRRYRNTLRYLLGALDGFDGTLLTPYDQLPTLEKSVLSHLVELKNHFDKSVDTVDFQSFYSRLHAFCSVDLSAFYLDIRKDSLYCDPLNAPKRQAALTTMHYVFQYLAHFLSPVIPFTAEEAWQCRYPEKESLQLSIFPDDHSAWKDHNKSHLEIAVLRSLRSVMTSALEFARKNGVIGSSLQAKIDVYDPDGLLDKYIEAGEDFAELLIVSQFFIHKEPVPENAYQDKNLGVVISKATDDKCARCWKILPDVGSHRAHPTLCSRCTTVCDSMVESAG